MNMSYKLKNGVFLCLWQTWYVYETREKMPQQFLEYHANTLLVHNHTHTHACTGLLKTE